MELSYFLFQAEMYAARRLLDSYDTPEDMHRLIQDTNDTRHLKQEVFSVLNKSRTQDAYKGQHSQAKGIDSAVMATGNVAGRSLMPGASRLQKYRIPH